MQKKTSFVFALGLLVLAACNGTVVVDDALSPLPTNCTYIPQFDADGGDRQFVCPAEIESALAECPDGVTPYREARCSRHPTMPEVWCCPIGVWPRDPAGDFLPPHGVGGGSSGGGGGWGGAGGGPTTSASSSGGGYDGGVK